MQKRLYIVILFMLTTIVLLAQQIPHFTQYMYNMNVLNPAYSGARADLSIGLLSRSQWVGLDGAPKTNTFSLNARTFDSVGLGLSVVQDKIGLFEDLDVNADFSYTLVTSPKSRLALGVKAGLSSFSDNLSQGITPDNEIYNNTSGYAFNFGVGAFYYNQKFYVGLSIPQLLDTPKFKLDETESTGLNPNLNYFATAGIVFKVNENLKYKPSTLIKVTTGLPVSVDINSNFLYKDQFELGVSYRYEDSISGMFAIIVNKSLRIGYAYDYTITNLGDFNNGSHEIMLLLDLDFLKRKRWLNNSSCYF